MTHEQAVILSQITSLVLFGTMFAAVLVYALWPGNRQRFEKAARASFENAGNDRPMGE